MTCHLLRSFPWFNSSFKLGLYALLLLLPIAQGCKKPDGPPPPISLEQLPAALEKAFAKAKPEFSEPISTLQGTLRDKDYSKALMAMQAVAALPGLNKEQANVAAAGLVSINNALQEAQSQGDQNATQTLQMYRATK